MRVPTRSLPISTTVIAATTLVSMMVACAPADSPTESGKHVSAVERDGSASPPETPAAASATPANPRPESPSESNTPASDPERIVIDDIGVDASIVEVGLAVDGSMQTPEYHENEAGWYTEGPYPGDPGPAVIVAHVDGPSGDDVFARLDELDPGDEITVIDDTDSDHTFIVERLATSDKDTLPYDEIWGDTPEPVLRLITCHGDYVSGEYEDNLIVYAAEGP